MGPMADLRFALRAILKRPGFSAVVISILALGLGANTVVFGVVDTLMLRPVPFQDPDRLVRVLAVNEALGVDRAGLAVGDFRDFRAQTRSLEGLAAYTGREFALTGGETPVVVRGALVSPGLFSLLKVEPAEGRGFGRREERPGEGRVAVLSRQLRRDHFGDGPVLGRTVELDGQDHEVVGVMPEGFHFPGRATRLWVPLTVDEGSLDRMSHFLGALGRLAPGATAERAGAELEGIAATLAELYPESNQDWTVRAVALPELLAQPFRANLLFLSAAVALLLLIVCANVANLLLVRATSRQKEMAVRAALGCSRRRAVRLVLFESTLYALLGAGLGLFLAHWGFRALVAFGPARIPELAGVGLTAAAALFTFAVALVTGLGFGVVPALQLSRLDLHHVTKEVHGSLGRTSSWLRSGLVVVEVAIALVLVIGAALMLKGFVQLTRVELGFEPDDVLALQIRLSPSRYPTVPPQVELFEGLLAEARNLPGVTSAAAGSAIPLFDSGQNLLPFEPESWPGEPGQAVFADFSAVTPDFFRTLRIPLLAGRDFQARDDAAAPPVLIVNERLARLYWPGQRAVGQRLLGTIWGTEPVEFEVVGVVGGVRHRSLAEAPGPAVYAPYLQVPHLQMMVVSRVTEDALGHAKPIGLRLQELDGDQPIARVATLAELVGEAGGRERFDTGLFSLFAGIGLLLAALGIYGVITYTFARRKQELAVRMALGADSRSIFALVVREGFILTVLGLFLGLVAALALAGLASSLLFGVAPRDPWVFTLALLVLLAVGLFASSLSARRAARIGALAPLFQGERAP